MKASFLDIPKPYLATIIEGGTCENLIAAILNAEHEGSQAFMVNLTGLPREELCMETMGRIFRATGRPIMPLLYRSGSLSAEKITDDERADLLLMAADAGASGCDIIGNLFDPQAELEMTYEPRAVEKQRRLIGELRSRGTQALISSHVARPMNRDKIVTQMLAMQERGADIAKLIAHVTTKDELLVSFDTILELEKTLDIPFIHLCNGRYGRLQRYVAPMLGSMLTFSISNYRGSLSPQPLVRPARMVLDELTWHRDWAESQAERSVEL